MKGLTAELEAAFAQAYGERPAHLAVAPGRVNLIGEHTDYNDGFVLPMAIDHYLGVAFKPRADGRVRAYSPEFGERAELEVAAVEPGSPTGWAGYVAGMIWAAREAGIEPIGMDLAVIGRVPMGAGLSSSAALEMAMARAICQASGVPWDAERMALLGQRAERDYVGVSCGIMDQFASAMSADGCALLLDCRSLETEPAPMPPGVVVVVMDTGVRRTLAGSEYNERYGRCQEAVAQIRRRYPEVRALRDVSPEMLGEFAGVLDPVTYRRAQHVVSETLRPRLMADALRGADLLRAGRLMNESHQSLRDLYQVSCEELDLMVSLAGGHRDCFGARLTGAGFGGCAIALVRRTGVDDFIEAVAEAYGRAYSHTSALYPCEAAPGAHLAC